MTFDEHFLKLRHKESIKTIKLKMSLILIFLNYQCLFKDFDILKHGIIIDVLMKFFIAVFIK